MFLVTGLHSKLYFNSNGIRVHLVYKIKRTRPQTAMQGQSRTKGTDNAPSLNHMRWCTRKIFGSPIERPFERICLFPILFWVTQKSICTNNRLTFSPVEFVVKMLKLQLVRILYLYLFVECCPCSERQKEIRAALMSPNSMTPCTF